MFVKISQKTTEWKGEYSHREGALELVGKWISEVKMELRAYRKHVEISKTYCIAPEKIAMH